MYTQQLDHFVVAVIFDCSVNLSTPARVNSTIVDRSQLADQHTRIRSQTNLDAFESMPWERNVHAHSAIITNRIRSILKQERAMDQRSPPSPWIYSESCSIIRTRNLIRHAHQEFQRRMQLAISASLFVRHGELLLDMMIKVGISD